jgi:hypothetical protein
MPLLAPDILEEVRQLPPLLPVVAFAVGLALWLWGGRGHRFWLALVLTVAAGSLGLVYGRAYGTQPLVAGLLLAVAAGALALSLVRILLFAAGGLAGLALARAVAPGWDEPLVAVVSGGLLGVLLYRLWVMALSALVGTLLMAHAALGLIDRLGKFDSAAWADRNAPLLNWAVAGAALAGMLVQYLLERRRHRGRARAKAARREEDRLRAAPPPPPPPPPPPKEPWWKPRRPGGLTRHAG